MRKDSRYIWSREEVPRLRDQAFSFFAVDDSEVMIANSRHTLLAALSFREPAEAVDRMAKLRAELALEPDFEFKWNQQGLARDQRDRVADEMRQILWDSFGLLVVCEGTDRQKAAQILAAQIGDLIDGPTVPFVIFDEEIIRDERGFRRFLTTSGDASLQRMQFSSARSFAHDLVQCADVFAGFQNLKIRLALGEAANRLLPGDFDGDEIALSDLLEVSFRYVLWGQTVKKVDPDWKSEDAPPPDWIFKETEGLGMRIHSSLDDATKALLYDEVGRPYLGCWH